ncbi:MAG: hypothetical protein ACLSTO_08615 [Bilophila wadsworthia]
MDSSITVSADRFLRVAMVTMLDETIFGVVVGAPCKRQSVAHNQGGGRHPGYRLISIRNSKKRSGTKFLWSIPYRQVIFRNVFSVKITSVHCFCPDFPAPNPGVGSVSVKNGNSDAALEPFRLRQRKYHKNGPHPDDEAHYVANR